MELVEIMEIIILIALIPPVPRIPYIPRFLLVIRKGGINEKMELIELIIQNIKNSVSPQ